MDRKLTLAMSGNDTKLHKLFYNLYGFHRLQLSIDACVGKINCQEFELGQVLISTLDTHFR